MEYDDAHRLGSNQRFIYRAARRKIASCSFSQQSPTISFDLMSFSLVSGNIAVRRGNHMLIAYMCRRHFHFSFASVFARHNYFLISFSVRSSRQNCTHTHKMVSTQSLWVASVSASRLAYHKYSALKASTREAQDCFLTLRHCGSLLEHATRPE